MNSEEFMFNGLLVAFSTFKFINIYVFVLQIVFACREYARRAVDVIARRTRLAFLNVPATEEALPRIVEIMAQELKWSKAKQKVNGIVKIQIQYVPLITRIFYRSGSRRCNRDGITNDAPLGPFHTEHLVCLAMIRFDVCRHLPSISMNSITVSNGSEMASQTQKQT